MKTKKISLTVALAIVLTMVLSACTSSTAYTYDVETGDKIVVKLDTQTGYSQSNGNPFSISDGNTVLSQGIFSYAETYAEYKTLVESGSDPIITDFKEGEKDGNPYVYYECISDSDTEHNYIVKVADSNTTIILGSQSSQEIAEKVFDALEFSVAEE